MSVDYHQHVRIGYWKHTHTHAHSHFETHSSHSTHTRAHPAHTPSTHTPSTHTHTLAVGQHFGSLNTKYFIIIYNLPLWWLYVECGYGSGFGFGFGLEFLTSISILGFRRRFLQSVATLRCVAYFMALAQSQSTSSIFPLSLPPLWLHTSGSLAHSNWIGLLPSPLHHSEVAYSRLLSR